MSYTLHPKAVRLEFSAQAMAHDNLSGAVFTGEWLWVAGDESCAVERLQLLPRQGAETLRFGQSTSFRLADLLDLPGEPDEEADLEGMALAGGYLWVVGSHGLKRKSPKQGRSHVDNARRLAKLSLDGNRRLLARLPLAEDSKGRPTLQRTTLDGRQAARLGGNARDNQLTDALACDPHYGPYLHLPGKDNGFDIEGLAVLGDRLLLGLRGPVLRGWAGLLELRIVADGDQLCLAPLGEDAPLLRKHFLDLEGLGIRDLHLAGDDLYLLAGPTMVLDGEIRLYRWKDARKHLSSNQEAAVFWSEFETCATLPHGRGCNRAEAFCAVPMNLARRPSWLALYDAPGKNRREGEAAVFGDLLEDI
ncbi:DUF3616 domain-containing protein [Chitinimonas viridis]|uniref:DUF3616 domain-containing protein n=1 Tax=Chitinimonas viridis TaxID=664880 RepID=A0ABT8B3J5_9NEIS|nr:DUF3616 domain-containing protein [Chitinimonas viridis]MDN3576589.1 DUF3616 domain-containing protein [Chitinimonas viridis]